MRVEAAAEVHGWILEQMSALAERAEATRRVDLRAAIELHRQVYVVADRAGVEAPAWTWLGYGVTLLYMGRADEADAAFSEVVRLCEGHDERLEMCALAWLRRAMAAHVTGDLALVEARLARAQELLDRTTVSAWTQCCMLEVHGELARQRGDRVAARGLLREQLAMLEAIGAPDYSCRLNLGHTWVEDGRYDNARPFLERAVSDAVRTGHGLFELHGRVVLQPCLAGLGDWAEFDANMTRTQALWGELTMRNVGFAEVVALAGDLAAQAGFRARAREAWTLALTMAEAEGSGDAEALRARLRRELS